MNSYKLNRSLCQTLKQLINNSLTPVDLYWGLEAYMRLKYCPFIGHNCYEFYKSHFLYCSKFQNPQLAQQHCSQEFQLYGMTTAVKYKIDLSIIWRWQELSPLKCLAATSLEKYHNSFRNYAVHSSIQM